MLVLIPNEGYTEMEIDLSRFTPDKTINDIIYGWYAGTYIAIKK